MVLRLGVIGAGLKAADYARGWAAMDDVAIVAMAEVSEVSRKRFADTCEAAGAPRPAEYGDAESMLAAMQGQMDAVYVSTPHVFHGANALDVIEAGYDLLLEKPMVTTVDEALALVEAERRTGRTVVIAFQGGLSPLVHDTRDRARRGEFGELVSVSASIWEGWKTNYAGQWKQNPAISGGGFMFDTGAHMMNTVCVLADAEFARLSAFANNRGIAVDVATAVAARLTNGALVTFNAAGDARRAALRPSPSSTARPLCASMPGASGAKSPSMAWLSRARKARSATRRCTPSRRCVTGGWPIPPPWPTVCALPGCGTRSSFRPLMMAKRLR